MKLIKNVQFQQLLNLLLLIYLAFANHTLQTSLVMVLVLSFYAGAFELLLNRKFYAPYSAAITALGVVLMLGWLVWFIPFIAIAAAIIQKRYLKIDGPHIFNPSNFALIFALALFYPKALPIVGELGRESFVLYTVLVIGALILVRVNRFAISLSFLLSYTFLSYLLIGQSDPAWTLEHFIDSLYSSSFVVYILFMLTDPVTTPKRVGQQLLFGFFVALLSVGLDYTIGVRLWHMFIALFLVMALTLPLFRGLKDREWLKYSLAVLFSLTLTVIITLHKPLYFSM